MVFFNVTNSVRTVVCAETRHLGADNKGAGQKGPRAKRAQGKKGLEQKGREITMLRHRYIQGRNFFR